MGGNAGVGAVEKNHLPLPGIEPRLTGQEKLTDLYSHGFVNFLRISLVSWTMVQLGL
jgi:hypothetical protein